MLTGPPRSGKTTLLKKVIDEIPSKQGFLTKEIRKEVERVGFQLIAANGQTAQLAGIEKSSPVQVSRYFVYIDQLDSFLDKIGGYQLRQLLYLDEIGAMELYSEKFIAFAMDYLNSANNLIATFKSDYHHSLIDEIKSRSDLKIVEVNESNRNGLAKQLINTFSARV